MCLETSFEPDDRSQVSRTLLRRPSSETENGDIDAIIEAYRDAIVNGFDQSDNRISPPFQSQREFRRHERKVARKCFRKSADWKDKAKISEFLRDSTGLRKTIETCRGLES